ncbi:hypothetical protein ACFE04_023888 [Oxalis oulophora]
MPHQKGSRRRVTRKISRVLTLLGEKGVEVKMRKVEVEVDNYVAEMEIKEEMVKEMEKFKRPITIEKDKEVSHSLMDDVSLVSTSHDLLVSMAPTTKVDLALKGSRQEKNKGRGEEVNVSVQRKVLMESLPNLGVDPILTPLLHLTSMLRFNRGQILWASTRLFLLPKIFSLWTTWMSSFFRPRTTLFMVCKGENTWVSLSVEEESSHEEEVLSPMIN